MKIIQSEISNPNNTVIHKESRIDSLSIHLAVLLMVIVLFSIFMSCDPVTKVNTEEVTITNAKWMFSESDEAIISWRKKELDVVLGKLNGHELKTEKDLLKVDIAVGTAVNNPVIRLAQEKSLIDCSSLGEDDFILKSISIDGKKMLVIAGGSETSASYGVFELLERLGFRFLVSGDIYPEDTDLKIPHLDEIVTCTQPWRGFFISHCITTTSMMSLEDYEQLFDQMVKMRLNKVIFYSFDSDPYIDYSYKGERKLVGDISDPNSGYISYGRFHGSYLTEDIEVGREKFGDRKRIAPKEMQNVSSSDEALDTGKAFMQDVMRVASQRGIGIWVGFLPQFISPNMSKYTRKMARKHLHWSYWVSCTDSIADEINRARIKNIIKSYPDLEGISLGIPEGFFDDPYEESRKLVADRWDDYSEALEIQNKFWGKFWPTKERQEAHIRADIGFTEILLKTIKSIKELKPDMPVAVTTVCKAYLLTKLHDQLDKDISFVDIESRSLWTVDGAPLHLFRRMKGRDCAIIPRAVDDGSLAGMQFNLKLYDMDGFIRSGSENGTKGFIIQLTHTAGNEHNVDYLTRGLWNPDLTVEDYYKDYAETLFGEKSAGDMIKAFDILEDNEIALGGRGARNMPWNQQPGQIAALRDLRDYDLKYYNCLFKDDNIKYFKSLSEKYIKAIGKLTLADRLFSEAHKNCRSGGIEMLDYIIQRTRGYKLHLEALVRLTDAFEQYNQSFKVLNKDLNQFKSMLDQTILTAYSANEKTIQSAQHFAACTRRTSDLGVLWSVNISMIKGTRLFARYLESIKAFYDGKDYDYKLEWEKVFGTCPFPTYELKKSQEINSGYEPG